MRYAPWIALMILGLAVGCDDSADDDGTAGGDVGGGGSTSSGTGGSTSSGTGGTAGGGAGVPDCGGGTLLGDPDAWAGIQKENISCTKNSDCCVVINDCLSEGQIVHASDYALAQTAWPYCQYHCAQCVPPFVDVACVDGICVGESTEWAGERDMEESHCGVDDEPVDITVPATTFSC